MADKSISELVSATSVGATDLFVLEQNNTAKKLTGQTLENWLVSFADGHGGIHSLVKTSSSGTNPVIDTYTITYADQTTSTFQVKNGVKGDKGDSQYVHIKYSSAMPTKDSDMYDTPDDYIGIYSGASSTAPTDYTSYSWFKYKGEKGDIGTPATITSQAVEYQAGTSGTIIPSGTWTTTIPIVPNGSYLWTKTTVSFNSGSPVISYSVARMGIDGTGSVSSVAGVSPDATGNVNLTADDVGAAPTNHTHTPESIGAADAVHTHMTQDISDLSVTAEEINRLSGVSGNVQAQIDNVTAALSTKVNSSEKGVANGVATLDGKGKVTANQASSSIVVIEANTTLSASHLGKFLNASSKSAITITIPNSSDIPVGAEVEIYHHGAGAVYVQSDANTYVSFDGKSTASRKLTIPRFGAIGMKKVTTATWKISGEAEG